MNEFKCPICEKVFSSDSILEMHEVSAHRSAQDAMNRQQEEIRILISHAKDYALHAGYKNSLNDALLAIDSLIAILAKMNGVEDALK